MCMDGEAHGLPPNVFQRCPRLSQPFAAVVYWNQSFSILDVFFFSPFFICVIPNADGSVSHDCRDESKEMLTTMQSDKRTLEVSTYNFFFPSECPFFSSTATAAPC
jgi:hypothetical protein